MNSKSKSKKNQIYIMMIYRSYHEWDGADHYSMYKIEASSDREFGRIIKNHKAILYDLFDTLRLGASDKSSKLLENLNKFHNKYKRKYYSEDLESHSEIFDEYKLIFQSYPSKKIIKLLDVCDGCDGSPRAYIEIFKLNNNSYISNKNYYNNKWRESLSPCSFELDESINSDSD